MREGGGEFFLFFCTHPYKATEVITNVTNQLSKQAPLTNAPFYKHSLASPHCPFPLPSALPLSGICSPLTFLSYPAPFPPATFLSSFTGCRGRESASCEGLCHRGVGADGSGSDCYGTLRTGWPARGQGWPEEDDGEGVRGVLKRRVETRQHTEEAIRQQEVEQLDFRDLLGKRVSTKTVSEEDLKEIPAEQMDFRANLQRQVKPKTVSEEERKVHSPQQVDFRSVLAKKGTPKTPVPEKVPPPKPAIPDFRSVLGSKKKLPAENGSNSAEALNARAAESPKAVGNAQPSGSLKPMGNAKPAETPKPLGNAKLAETPEPWGNAKPAKTPEPLGNAKPAETPEPLDNAKPAETLKPVGNTKLAETSKPVGNAKPSETPKPAGKEELKKEVKNDVNCKRGHSGATDNEKRPESQGTAPTFKEKLRDVHVSEGEKLLLQCQVSSDPPATITWTLNGKTLKTTKFIILSQEGNEGGGWGGRDLCMRVTGSSFSLGLTDCHLQPRASVPP